MIDFMARNVIGEISKQEIITAMRGLTGTAARIEADRLAQLHGVRRSHIYRITEHLRENHKTRSDAGQRKFKIVPGTDMWNVAELVVAQKMLPEQAYQSILYNNPDADLPHLQTFNTILREDFNLGSKIRKTPRRGHRRFEGLYPGHIFQCDVTALKVRWEDERTRRILRIEGVDKNHPMMDDSILRVWQMMILDDCSRTRFLRYTTTRAITSTEMVRFLCEAYSILGVPRILYTDNGSEFKGRHVYAADILNKAIGEYRHEPHAPNNAQATGKVEVAHRWAENIDRWVGYAIAKGRKISVGPRDGCIDINLFADRLCERYNNNVCRATKQTPMDRWINHPQAEHRLFDRKLLEAALLSQQLEVLLSDAMTISVNGEIYQLPRTKDFIDYHGRKILVVATPHIDLIHVTLPNHKGKFEPTHGGKFTVPKVLAGVDAAGDYHAIPETSGQQLTKQLKASWKAKLKVERDLEKQTGIITPIPHIDVEMPLPEGAVKLLPSSVLNFVPPPLELPAAQEIADDYEETGIGYWQAVAEYQSEFADGPEAQECLLALFPDKSGEATRTEIEAFISEHKATPSLKIVG